MGSSGWQRVALGAWLVAVAPIGLAEDIGVMGRQYGEWMSGVLIEERPTRFRVAAEHVEAGSYTAFSIDVVEGDCVQRFAALEVHLRGPIEQDLLTKELEGALRIDRYPVHRVFYRVGAMAGDFVIRLFLTEIEREQAFWKEMAAGRSVRFRLPTERKDYYLRFSLDGFAEGLLRAIRLCNELSAEDDRAYFEK